MLKPRVVQSLTYPRNTKLDEALKMIQEAVSVDPTNPSYLESLGWAYFKLGKLTEAEKFLKDAIGLDTPSVGHQAVAQAVLRRATALCEGDLDAYWSRLRDSASEGQALVECIVVPETWFFRDPAAFDAVAPVVNGKISGPVGNAMALRTDPCARYTLDAPVWRSARATRSMPPTPRSAFRLSNTMTDATAG